MQVSTAQYNQTSNWKRKLAGVDTMDPRQGIVRENTIFWSKPEAGPTPSGRNLGRTVPAGAVVLTHGQTWAWGTRLILASLLSYLFEL